MKLQTNIINWLLANSVYKEKNNSTNEILYAMAYVLNNYISPFLKHSVSFANKISVL